MYQTQRRKASHPERDGSGRQNHTLEPNQRWFLKSSLWETVYSVFKSLILFKILLFQLRICFLTYVPTKQIGALWSVPGGGARMWTKPPQWGEMYRTLKKRTCFQWWILINVKQNKWMERKKLTFLLSSKKYFDNIYKLKHYEESLPKAKPKSITY